MKKTDFIPFKVFDELSKVFYWIASIYVFGAMVAVFLNVILRYMFNAPWFWTEEVTALLMALLTFFAAAEILRTRRHIKLNIFLDRFPEKIRRILDIFFSVIGLGFCGVLSWQFIDTAKLAYTIHMKSPTLLSVPYVIPYGLMGLGVIILFFQFMLRIIRASL